MQVTRLGWLGTRTVRYQEMVRFYRDVLGLEFAHEDPNASVFRLPTGDLVEVFREDFAPQAHFTTGPVVGFRVIDIDQAREALVTAGIELLGPLNRMPDGYAWQHFRAPDGNVYELTYSPAEAAR